MIFFLTSTVERNKMNTRVDKKEDSSKKSAEKTFSPKAGYRFHRQGNLLTVSGLYPDTDSTLIPYQIRIARLATNDFIVEFFEKKQGNFLSSSYFPAPTGTIPMNKDKIELLINWLSKTVTSKHKPIINSIRQAFKESRKEKSSPQLSYFKMHKITLMHHKSLNQNKLNQKTLQKG